MKKLLYVLIGIGIQALLLIKTQSSAHAQTPQPIYSFARVSKSTQWYKEQAVAWKRELDKNQKNAYAWYNYYRVNRNLAYTDTTDKRQESFKELEKIVNDMEKQVPNSYEFNLCKWMNNGNNYEYLSYLKKADELGPDRTEHIPDMIVYGEIERNKERKYAYAKRWFESGQTSPGLLYYNYNVMIGLKPNAIIITTGDNDTYPLWILQSQGIRQDVTVLNLSLLYVDAYRDKIFKELGVEKWDMKYVALKADSTRMSNDPVDYDQKVTSRYEKGIIRHIAANRNHYPVYAALTIGTNYTKPVEDHLYLVGLSYEYSDESIDNIAIMKRNFEQQYALDYIDKYFYEDMSSGLVQHINNNYMVPMLKLFSHYKTAGDTQKAEWIKTKALLLVKGKPEEQETRNYFNQK